MTETEDYNLESKFDEGSCDEEEEYHPIPRKEKEEEAPNLECEYTIPTTPCKSLEVIPRNLSPYGIVN